MTIVKPQDLAVNDNLSVIFPADNDIQLWDACVMAVDTDGVVLKFSDNDILHYTWHEMTTVMEWIRKEDTEELDVVSKMLIEISELRAELQLRKAQNKELLARVAEYDRIYKGDKWT